MNNIESYRTLDDLQKAVASASEGASGVNTSINSMRATAAVGGSAISIRNEYNRGHYDAFRPSEKVPVSDREIMLACNNSYYTVGIVRNIVDLMADFCIKGIDWSHANRNVQAFYRTWFQTVGGVDVSERFCNYLVRLGNNCIYTNYMKIPDTTAQQWRKSKGEEFKDITVSSRKIPSKYIFMDITSLSELYPEIGKLTNKRLFMLSLASGLVNSFNTSAQTNGSMYDISRIIQHIPGDLKRKMTENNGNLVFEEGELGVFHYKKDDWESWSKPLIYSILEPLLLLKKMHLADMSALDGAISNIRLWRLGYIDQNNALNSIIPTKAMLNKVREVVLSNISGGTLDIFWGPELDFKESNSEVHKFLGPEKYKHVMSLIYDGMGIPANLTGGGGGSDGFTNNFISMKVLIEKLNYLRSKLTDFWTEQAKIVQKAMGFSSPAKIVFDDAILSDEGQYKKLLIDLYDRDVISLESLREEFNLIDPIESSRVLREIKRRDKQKSPERSSPYHDPMWRVKLNSEMVKNGMLDPTIIGIEANQEDIIKAVKGPSDGGRPTGAKDQTKRKQKIVRPRTSAEQLLETQVWAKENFEKISEVITPAYVKAKGREYARELTHAEASELENIKLGVLGAHIPFSDISEDSIEKACNSYIDTSELKVIRDTLLERFVEKFKRKPTIEDKRVAACAAYALINS